MAGASSLAGPRFHEDTIAGALLPVGQVISFFPLSAEGEAIGLYIVPEG
jgi:hypothetical protein